MTSSSRKIHRALPLFTLLIAACATTPPPTGELDDAVTLVGRAREGGAARYAPVEMGFAEDKLARAHAAHDGKDHAAATTLAQQAQVDAELALVKARQAKARAAVQAKSEENARLRRELLGEGQRP
jgi:hypothetical protein